MPSGAYEFIKIVGTIVSNIWIELSVFADLFLYAIAIMIVLAIHRQIGYRNGD